MYSRDEECIQNCGENQKERERTGDVVVDGEDNIKVNIREIISR
jgi:hypothetical protein